MLILTLKHYPLSNNILYLVGNAKFRPTFLVKYVEPDARVEEHN
jgi:hypothetical protein